MTRADWLPWAAVAAGLSLLMLVGSAIGSVKGREPSPDELPATVRLELGAPARPVPVGLRFQVDVTAETDVSTGGFSLDLRYPASLARLDRVEVHPEAAGAARGLLVLEPVVDPAAGVVHLAARACPAKPCGGPVPALEPIGASGRFPLVSAVFTATAAGEGTVALEAVAVGDTGARLQPVAQTPPAALAVVPPRQVVTWYDPVAAGGQEYLLAVGQVEPANEAALALGDDTLLVGELPTDWYWVTRFAGWRRGPALLAPRSLRGVHFARRTYAPAPSELVGWSTEALASRWHFPLLDPADGPAALLVANLNGAPARVRATLGDAALPDWVVPAGATYALPLSADHRGPLRVETTLPLDGSPLATLTTLRLGSEAAGFVVEVAGTPETELAGGAMFPWFDGTDPAPDRLIVANPGRDAVAVEVDLGGAPLRRLTLDPVEARAVALPAVAAGPLVVRGRSPVDPAASAPVLAELRAGGGGRPVLRLLPGLRADRLTAATDFWWPALTGAAERETLIIANPHPDPLGYTAIVLGDGARAGTVPPFGTVVIELPAGAAWPIRLAGYDPGHPDQPRALLATKRVVRAGVVGEIRPIARSEAE